jgi:hypothetical protein
VRFIANKTDSETLIMLLFLKVNRMMQERIIIQEILKSQSADDLLG